MLSDSESDTEDTHQFTINEHYAKAFHYRKEREELEKLKLKYGSDYELDDEDDDEEDEDSESDESEDEDGEELTPAVDAAILRTLARIKQKDPEIYESEKNIFGEEQSRISSSKTVTRAPKNKDSKPVTLRQVVLQSTLNPTSRSPSPELTHVEAQRELRDETIAAFTAGDEDEDDDLLDELQQEEEEYKAFLEREVGKDLGTLIGFDQSDVLADESSPQTDKKPKKKKQKASESGKSKEEENQEFLMNYILNRGWIDKTSKRIPTYREVTSKDKGKAKATADESDDEEENAEDQRPTIYSDVDEEEFEDTIDRFEISYNHRFEEPDALEIKSFPRNLPSLVRREDTTRKDARERKKQRKAEELSQKKEEVKRLKALKMKEIRAKLERIGREGGKNVDNDPALQELDLDADWDPDAHDAQMTGLYGEDADFNDDEKPTWDDDIDIGDLVGGEEDTKSKKKKKKKKKKADDQDQEDGVDVDVMDAEVQPADEDEDEWDGTEEMRKRKLDQYLDELYELDFNDMVGGVKTKFRYAPVQAQNFSLTPAEILMATDAELNEYMGVKKYAPYKKDLKWDPNRNDKLKDLKSKIAARTGGADKRKGKKERMRLKLEDGGGEGEERIWRSADEEDDAALGESTKKKKRRHKKKAEDAIAT
ncbi:hypothetical protein BDZ89DRAFT_1058086 [Hymenopellis radicata]|nr:hypothetical protein BDZ89DRAFT_1058086 [Hymenopellis radicata]